MEEAEGAVPQNLEIMGRMKRGTKDSLREEEEVVGDKVKGEDEVLIMMI